MLRAHRRASRVARHTTHGTRNATTGQGCMQHATIARPALQLDHDDRFYEDVFSNAELHALMLGARH